MEIYADETGTQGLKKGGPEPAPGVYGFMATPSQWDVFRKAWSDGFKKYNAPYFHFRELLPQQRGNRTNPYFGWDDVKTDDFIHDTGYEYEFHSELFMGDDANGNWLHIYWDYSLLGEEAPRAETVGSGASSLTINGDTWSNLSWSGVTFSAIDVVPEPSTLALAGLGVVSVLLQRRRSRS